MCGASVNTDQKSLAVKTCKDCAWFKVFEYKTHGFCRYAGKRTIVRAEEERCPKYEGE